MAKSSGMPIAFGLIAVGGTFLWAGIKGQNPIDLLKSPFTGKMPPEGSLAIAQIGPAGIGNPVTGAGYPGVPAGTPQNAMRAINWAAKQISNPTQNWHDKCLEFVEDAYGNPIGNLGNAANAWTKCRSKHPHTPYSLVPAGALVWWGGGRGHVALSIGGGFCISTDIKRDGMADRVRIGTITRKWHKPYLGYTDDLAGVKLI